MLSRQSVRTRVEASWQVDSRRQEARMGDDEARIREFARSYTDAWCSHDPTRVADHFVTGGTIAINGGDPTEVTEVAATRTRRPQAANHN